MEQLVHLNFVSLPKEENVYTIVNLQSQSVFALSEMNTWTQGF
jgi:hypothetical protein